MNTPLSCVVAHIIANLENLTDEQIKTLNAHTGYEMQDREMSQNTDTHEKIRFVDTVMGWQ